MDSVPRTIPLNNGQHAIVDAADYPALMSFKWRAVKRRRLWYAKTTVGQAPHRLDLSMSRLIAMTPKDKVCHHANRNSLDNRRCNLLNMIPMAHKLLHANNRLRVKFKTS